MNRLTEQQARVRDMIAHGLTNKEIGRALGISPRTVEDHRRNVFRKYGVHNPVELVRLMLGAPLRSLPAPPRDEEADERVAEGFRKLTVDLRKFG